MANVYDYLDNSGFLDLSIKEVYNSVFNLCNGIFTFLQDLDQPAFIFLKNKEFFGLKFLQDSIKNQIIFDQEINSFIKEVSSDKLPDNVIRLTVPETLIVLLYIPNQLWHIPLGASLSTQMRLELQKYFVEGLEEEGPEDGVKDFVFENKEFGDTALFEFPEYKLLLKTFILDYERYKDQIPLEYFTGANSQITGINDELQKIGKTFDYKAFCNSLTANLKFE